MLLWQISYVFLRKKNFIGNYAEIKIKSIISYEKFFPYKKFFFIGNYAFMANSLCIFKKKIFHRKLLRSRYIVKYK